MKARRIIMGVIFLFGYIGTIISGPLSAVNASMEASPKPIIGSLIFSLILLVFPRREGQIKDGVYPGLFRRYIAANIDIVIATLFMISLLFPILLLVENSARDTWAWSWETAISPYYLPVLILGIIAAFIGIYAYFRFHLERRRATPGQYIMGYKIMPTGEPNYKRRIWNGALWLWLWIFAWMGRTETEGVYTWDKNSNSQAVLVE